MINIFLGCSEGFYYSRLKTCDLRCLVFFCFALFQTPANAKVVLAKAVEKLPHSVKLWIQAAQLEQTDTQKKVVLRKGLPHNILPRCTRRKLGLVGGEHHRNLTVFSP